MENSQTFPVKDSLKSNFMRSANHHHLTDRQLRYMSARIEGKPKFIARKIAGYSSNVSTSYIENSDGLKRGLKVVLEQKGITPEFVADKIRKGLDAEKLIYTTFEGQITDTKSVPDNEIQHKYVRDILEIRGDIKNVLEQNVQIGLIGLEPQAPESWNESS